MAKGDVTVVKGTKLPAKVAKCECENPGQDKIHGFGNRVFNPTLKEVSSTTRAYRCTVCLKIRTLSK